MLVRAPIDGVVEWCCAPGQHVARAAVLAWVAGPGRCGLVPLTAPDEGLVTWRREAALASVRAGAPVLVLGEDAGAALACEAGQREAAREALVLVDQELAALDAQPASSLSAALLGPQREEALRRRERLLPLVEAGAPFLPPRDS